MSRLVNLEAYRAAGGISDDALDHERDAQKRLQAAIIDFTNAIKLVNYQSSLVHIDIDEWESFLHDSIPNFGTWDEKTIEARNP